ncbi:hypothetical protein FSP39_018180 [Pinctada imbricata]|uniref:Ion transport domain-containing protein n=1 Tax=Pinctada imbricata TaxID=66713 RepID=A0AA88XPR3_PINIB|nr:hypothetical protein FSP39_018180 [Pinctada imbricata]
MKFLLLVILVFGAFMVGLHNLFWYYSVQEHVEVTDHMFEFQAKKYFGDVLSTFRTVFFSMFGRGDTDVVTLGGYENKFTEDTGYIIYGSYNIAMVIVLLNMLIAMMTRSFQDIAEDADTEWKFSRSVLYMDYIGEGGSLPVPLNILGGPRAFIRGLWRACCTCSSKDEFENPPPSTSAKSNVISNNTVHENTASKYDDFEEIKQDISSFRYEMLNNMQVREAESVEIQEMLKTILSILTNNDEGCSADFKKTKSVSAADRMKFKSFVAEKMAQSERHVVSED